MGSGFRVNNRCPNPVPSFCDQWQTDSATKPNSKRLRDRRYSSRRASVGLTFEARHAGMNAAASVPVARTSAAAATVAGSVAVTPKN
jgi:hypothetical protein